MSYRLQPLPRSPHARWHAPSPARLPQTTPWFRLGETAGFKGCHAPQSSILRRTPSASTVALLGEGLRQFDLMSRSCLLEKITIADMSCTGSVVTGSEARTDGRKPSAISPHGTCARL